METGLNYVQDIVVGRTNWRFRVRVIRLWTMPDQKAKQDVGTIDMIIVDEKFGKIQITIPRQWIARFKNVVQEGQGYILENLNVGKNDKSFAKTTHKFKLNFMGITKVTTAVVNKIPPNVFDFLDFPSILETKKTDIFIDAIGHVVEKNNIRDKEINGKKTKLLEVVFEDLAQHRVQCSLWGDNALQMQHELEMASPDAPFVVVIQMCRLNRYQNVGNISSAWYGTKLFINEDIPAIHDYRSRFVDDETFLTQGVTQMNRTTGLSIGDELMNTKRMTIAELIEAKQPCLGCVLVDVVEFDMSEGWAFNSCNTCFRSANKVGPGFTCKHCNTLVSATARYKLNVVVIDDTGSTTFTLFNGLVSKIVGKSAVDLISSYEERGILKAQPAEFEPLLGKRYLFKVEVSNGNIEKGFATYTSRKFTSETHIIQRFTQKHSLNVCTEEEEAEINLTLDNLSALTPVIDLGDSTSTDKTVDYFEDFEATPSSKQLGKRPATDFEGIDLNNMDFSSDSIKRLSKGVVKIEPKE